jgi:hypothetical protein
LAAALAVGLWFGATMAPVARAQEPITVVSESPRNEFPAGVSFTISFRAPAGVDEARLVYELAPDGTGASARADDCTGPSITNCTITLTSGRGLFIIPGAEITYHWEIKDTTGAELKTDEKLYVHQDSRFDFRTLQDGNITVYYNAGTESDAPAVLAATRETLDAIGRLEQTTVPFPIKVFLYETAAQMTPAIVPTGGRGVQVLGEVVYSDTAMVSADDDVLDITRHEVAHIVTRQATKGPFGIPDWMNEGTSVFAQRNPISGHETALQAAIRADRVLSMADLNSSASGGSADTVGLYYGQAGSMIGYLVNTYGEEKYAQLLKTFKDGSTPDKAFQSVYGFDALGYENEWRDSVGLSARTASATATPRPTEQARAQPTASGRNGDGARSGDSDDGGPGVLVIAIIAALALAAVGTAVATVSIVRSRL